MKYVKKLDRDNVYVIGLMWGFVWIFAGIVSWLYNRTLQGEAGQFLTLGVGSVITVVIQLHYTLTKNKRKEKELKMNIR